MKLISAVMGSVLLITHYDHLISCAESSEEHDVPKDAKRCPGGYCLAAYLCQNGSINYDGDDILEIRVGDYDDDPDPFDIDLNRNGDPCEEFLQRCCAYNRDIQVIHATKADNEEDSEIEPPPPSCGVNRPNGYVYKVKNESVAQFGEFPWMAALLQRETVFDEEKLKYFCGGSLIHPQVILTAAHCVKNFVHNSNKMVVRLGEWDTVRENEPLKHQQLGVRKIILHENFIDKKLHNDMALLILEEPATLNVHISPICLPNADENFDGQRCMVSGWGKENFNPEGKYSEVLKKIQLPVVSRKQCKSMLRATKLGSFFQLHSSFMCAGGEAGVDTCRGDGGSPLACQRDRGFVQAGIVAWGIGCGKGNVPGAYVKVSNFVDWIAQKMQQEGL